MSLFNKNKVTSVGVEEEKEQDEEKVQEDIPKHEADDVVKSFTISSEDNKLYKVLIAGCQDCMFRERSMWSKEIYGFCKLLKKMGKEYTIYGDNLSDCFPSICPLTTVKSQYFVKEKKDHVLVKSCTNRDIACFSFKGNEYYTRERALELAKNQCDELNQRSIDEDFIPPKDSIPYIRKFNDSPVTKQDTKE